jgi:hypothetical protein
MLGERRSLVQRFTPGPGPEARREIRIRTTFMKMVNPTLSTIQKRHPLVAQPLPPPPNTMMKRFMIHRQGGILTSFLTQICDVPNVSRYPLPSEGCSHRTSNQTTAAPGSRRGSVTRQPQGMTMQPPRALPRLQRNIDSPPRIAVGVVERGRAHGYRDVHFYTTG